ncbi:hypothetical protein Clacol_003160 [Clathrus columnatus]|uniref:Uncharacterized protein n=1 Tax=Clathrus columnatus TaxID=1419009 RepID=A0AAV5A3U9_9AGAM|nr:hypothetical protein Clacol_003160 [Clathrus columnatus]
MAPNFTFKRKHSEISESTANDTGVVENVLDSPTKRMRMECPINDENDQFNASTEESSLTSTELDGEEENEVLIILIPADEDITKAGEVEADIEREAETPFTTDSKDSTLFCERDEDSGESKDSESEQADTSESEHATALQTADEFYSGSPSRSRSSSPPTIFLIPLHSQAGPSNLSNTPHDQQQQQDSTALQPTHGTTLLPIVSHLDPPQPLPPPSIFEPRETLRRTFRPSPSPNQYRGFTHIHELSEDLDETEDAREEEEDENLDLIWAMFNGAASNPAEEVEAENRYPIYIEEMDIPWLEETVTHDADGDTVAPEGHTVLWEHADGHLYPEPPALDTFRTHIQEEEEEDPEARLKRLVREGEMGSDDDTSEAVGNGHSF